MKKLRRDFSLLYRYAIGLIEVSNWLTAANGRSAETPRKRFEGISDSPPIKAAKASFYNQISSPTGHGVESSSEKIEQSRRFASSFVLS